MMNPLVSVVWLELQTFVFMPPSRLGTYKGLTQHWCVYDLTPLL